MSVENVCLTTEVLGFHFGIDKRQILFAKLVCRSGIGPFLLNFRPISDSRETDLSQRLLRRYQKRKIVSSGREKFILDIPGQRGKRQLSRGRLSFSCQV